MRVLCILRPVLVSRESTTQTWLREGKITPHAFPPPALWSCLRRTWRGPGGWDKATAKVSVWAWATWHIHLWRGCTAVWRPTRPKTPWTGPFRWPWERGSTCRLKTPQVTASKHFSHAEGFFSVQVFMVHVSLVFWGRLCWNLFLSLSLSLSISLPLSRWV